MSNAYMLKQLHYSMKELGKARKIMDKIVDESIVQLPESKRKQALDLIKKAKQGKRINISEMMAFTKGVRSIDEEEIKKSIQEHLFNIYEKSSQEDILYEILLKAGFMPSERIKKIVMNDKRVFSIAEGTLLICLENELTSELIDEVADARPLQFICLDMGFKYND